MEKLKENLILFLEFRKKFTNRQWAEISQCIEGRINEKVANTILDDSDIQIILERLKSHGSEYR